MFRCSNVQMFKYSNVQLFKSSNLQIFKCSDIQMFKHSNVKCHTSIRLNFCRSVPLDDETFGAKWLKLCNKISRAAALCADKTYLNNWQETMQNIPFVKFVYGRAPQKWAFEYLCKSGSTSTEHQEGYYARHMSSHFTLNTSYVGVIKRQYFILR